MKEAGVNRVNISRPSPSENILAILSSIRRLTVGLSEQQLWMDPFSDNTPFPGSALARLLEYTKNTQISQRLCPSSGYKPVVIGDIDNNPPYGHKKELGPESLSKIFDQAAKCMEDPARRAWNLQTSFSPHILIIEFFVMVNGGGEFEINNASDVTSKVDPGRKRTIRVVARRVRVGPGAQENDVENLKSFIGRLMLENYCMKEMSIDVPHTSVSLLEFLFGIYKIKHPPVDIGATGEYYRRDYKIAIYSKTFARTIILYGAGVGSFPLRPSATFSGSDFNDIAPSRSLTATGSVTISLKVSQNTAITIIK
ncbi:uncharacterized protein DFL_004443 [Arthrobotrys flagrans]|uniref:Uncharacterized protein n=1 Tax=Arthrobotrys flagrans TaxID=97331 RepID=A0A437A4X4_ARTFL|nr:hypothetical protein DFL_004443 [Arthrobotrys flagrans]